MRAVRLHAADGPDAVTLENLPDPEPGPGEVRVRIKAAALNHRELWISRGLYPGMRLPATLGADGSGVVDRLGKGVDSTWLDTEVVLYPGLNWGPELDHPSRDFGLLGMPGPGTLADYIVVPFANVLPKPAHLSFAQAAALPLAGLTAWRGLFTKAELRSRERVLITGVGGGVAAIALQLAHAAGAEVHVTSGSPEKLARAQELGAAGGYDYSAGDFAAAIRAGLSGVNLVFDGAPARGYAAYAKCLAPGARVVIYGSTGGGELVLNVPDLFLRNLRVIGTNVGNESEFRAMLEFVAKHRIVPEVDAAFSLDQAPQALRQLATAHGFGKVVLTLGR